MAPPNNTVYLTTKDSVDINFVIDADHYTNDEGAYVKLNYNHNPTTYSTNLKDMTVALVSALTFRYLTLPLLGKMVEVWPSFFI